MALSFGPKNGAEQVKLQEYKRIRNQVQTATRRGRKDFELSLAKYVKTNPKRRWHYVNSKARAPLYPRVPPQNPNPSLPCVVPSLPSVVCLNIAMLRQLAKTRFRHLF